MSERILCAAIWYKEIEVKKDVPHRLPINCDRGIVFCGHRHPHCMYSMVAVTGIRSVTHGENSIGEHIQGFLTSDNRFVDREEAMRIAIKQDQGISGSTGRILFSEDLY